MSQRSDQVAEELRKILSMILIQDMHDPRMGFITITRIEMTPDLRFARVFYSVLGNEEKKSATVEALGENMRFIRRLAIQRINMKYAIDIKFEPDRSIEHGFRVEELLKKIKKKDNE